MIAQRSSSRFSIGVPVSPRTKSAFNDPAARASWLAGFFTFCISSKTTTENCTLPKL
jgi:hypothetical protein